MRRARLTVIAAALASLGAMSCLPSGGEAPASPDGGSGDGPPEIVCSNDSQCGNVGGCVASRCVPRAMNTSTWAIEIVPPLRSGSQLTELPSVESARPFVTASPEFELTIPFRGSEHVGATLPSSASVIVTVPSRIPGRPDLSFQNMLVMGIADPDTRTTNASAKIKMPEALRGQTGTVSLIPLAESEQMTPPYTFPITIPLSGMPLFALALPVDSRALSGLVLDALDRPKVQFTARAFRNGVVVSTSAKTGATSTNPAGNFVIILPAGAGDGITLQLAPDSSTPDPWVTYPGLFLTQQNTDLDAIRLPAILKTTPFQVTIHGGDAGGPPVSGATVRAQTSLEGGDTRVSTRFVRQSLSDGGGTANMPLMPGATGDPRPYTLSVVPPAGSIWASQCFDNVPAQWPGAAPVTLLRDVTLPRRAAIMGSVVSASGVPVANASVAAIRGELPMSNCLAGPAATSATTDATGSFTLPLDPGTYQLEFDPPAGSPLPRMIEPDVEVTTADVARTFRLPQPVLVEGDVRKGPTATAPLPNATVRIFEPRVVCPTTEPCPPWLRAETQTDANGHFRAILAQPGTN